jgi:hypothetical protein
MKVFTLVLSVIFIVALNGSLYAEKPLQSKTGPAAVGNGNVYFYRGADALIGVSTNGSLIYLEMPLGYEHIYCGTPVEGYALCYGPTTGNEKIAYDVYEADHGISLYLISASDCPSAPPGASGGTNYLSPDGNGCSKHPYVTNPATAPVITPANPLDVYHVTKTSDNALKIKNRIQWDGISRSITITTTVTNISGAPIKVNALKRFVDFDTDVCGAIGGADFDTNWHSVTGEAVFAWNDPADGGRHMVMLKAAPGQTPSLTNVDSYWNNFYTCPTDIADGPIPQTNQQDNADSIEWNLGTLGAGVSVSRTMTYTVF